MQAAAKNELPQAALGAKTRTADRTWTKAVIAAATKHWPEYLIEGAASDYSWYPRAASQFCCSIRLRQSGRCCRAHWFAVFLRALLWERLRSHSSIRHGA